MSATPPAPAPDPLPHERLWALITVHAVARCLHTIAEAGVADALGETAAPAAILAAETGLHPDALHRMLRLLAAHGVFAQTGHDFTHTAASRLLRSDDPHSMRAFARMIGLPSVWGGFTELAHAARTGRPAVDWPMLLEYFAQHADEAALFDQAMVEKSRAVLPAILAAYDFGACPVVADIGGGRGHLLQAVLAAWPSVRGVLFDLPLVIAGGEGMPDPRLERVGGDFFLDALPRADAYVLMEVLHDWNDADALRILAAVRRSAPPHARLLVVETLVPDAAEQHPGQVLDVIMLAVTGGRERSEADYRALLAQGGWALRRVIPTAAPLSLVEAAPA